MLHAEMLVAAVVAAHCAFLVTAGPAPPVSSEVWPQPVLMTTGLVPLAISINFSIVCAAPCPDPVPAGLVRYAALVQFAGPADPARARSRDDIAAAFAAAPKRTVVTQNHGRRPRVVSPPRHPLLMATTDDDDNGGTYTQLSQLVVRVGSSALLSPAVDESYSLYVPADGSAAVLTAATQWGALRGLESFAQLVIWQGPDDQFTYLVTNAPVNVSDYPRFQHRGTLIDTSFNFLTVQRVKDVLDSMPVMKANILHWHLFDDPAWSAESAAYPSCTGPAGPYASTAYYTIAQQVEMAQYAWERGVMILVEFDVPGHSSSWAACNASLVVACDGHQTLINPVGEPGDAHSIYAVLATLMTEFQTRLGSPGLPWVHLGGDEVTDYTCWLTDPGVQAWAASIGIAADSTSIRRAFTHRIQAVAKALGLRPLVWEETYLGSYGVEPGTIVTPWITPTAAASAVADGFDVLLLQGYYLDIWRLPGNTSGWYPTTVSYAFMDSLRLIYTYDPVFGTGVAAANASRVLGAVASAWGDNNDSGLGATSMLYPRALAAGEKFWSPASATNITDVNDPALDYVELRLEHARCKLVQRGIGAQPVGVAGDFGLCWRPDWGVAIAPTVTPAAGSDEVAVSSGGMAAVVLGCLAMGALGATAFAHRSALSSSLQNKHELLAVDSTSAAAFGSVKADPAAAALLPPARSSAGGPAAAAGSSRVLALDQMRGITMWCMLFVNLYYGRSGLPYFFSHGITYFSGPDLIEPAFHFCVGFALRLVLLKRLAVAGLADADGGNWWRRRWALFKPLFRTRVVGLILLSMFFTEGWGQFESWSDLSGFRDWLTQLVQDNQPYHTLTHIAFITVWTFLPMTMGWRVRAAQIVGTTLLHITLHATFYFRWIAEYPPGQGLDEGGYFGFFGWSIEALAGSLVHDLVVYGSTTWAAAGAHSGGDSGSASASLPLLDGSKDEGEASDDAASRSDSARRANMALTAWRVSCLSAALMLAGYLLSCLGAVAPATVCYNGEQIYFWGGFGPQVPCKGVPTLGGSGFFVYPPFVRPDPATNVVTMWTMTQRAGSATYHLFAAGTSSAIFALLYAVCEMGVPVPARVRAALTGPAAAPALRQLPAFLGLRWAPEGQAVGSRLYLRWHVAEVLGENALAVYLIGDAIGDNVGNMLPPDCPVWYFLLWGEGLYIGVALVAALYLRSHKLFLRL